MKKFREPIILAVALVLLASVAGYLAYTFPSVGDITGVSETTPKGKKPVTLTDEDLQANIAPWKSPAQWESKSPERLYRLFISSEYLFYPTLYPDGNYIQANDGTARSPHGVLLSWYQKYGIDIIESDVDYADPDGDGFSNIVEFKNGAPDAFKCDGTKSTNPRDPDSHPSYMSRLRLLKYEGIDFHIQFLSTAQLSGKTVFQINFTDLPSDKQPGLLSTGDKLGAEDYVVGDYKEIMVEETDKSTGLKKQVNKSTLELIRPAINERIILPFREKINSPESTADFVMLMPTERDKVIKVAKAQTFTPPFMPDKQYQVYRIDETGASATIHDTKTNEEFIIPKLDPAEWDEVPGAPASTAPATPAAPAAPTDSTAPATPAAPATSTDSTAPSKTP